MGAGHKPAPITFYKYKYRTMTLVTIAYHSKYGHTKKQAESVLNGCSLIDGVTAGIINVSEINDNDWLLLDRSNAIIFGSPTYMGSASADFKSFMDASSSRWMKQAWKNKIAAGFTNSGSLSGDKLSTLLQFVIFASQHSMIWLGLDVMPGTVNSDNHTLNRMGGSLGAMAQSDNAPADITPNMDDLATAKYLGKRIAEYAKKTKGL